MSRKTREPQNPSRRRFLGSLAAASGAALLPGCGKGGGNGADAGFTPGALPVLPKPEDSGIDHIVVVMMENRSFDHMLGWVPGADGKQAGLKFLDKDLHPRDSFRLSQDAAYGFQGCGWADPDHSYAGGRIQYNNGALDGWLLTPGTSATPDDLFPIGYYTDEDLPFYKGIVPNFTTLDRYHCSILSQTFPNRFYMHAGQTDRNDNALTFSTLPTIWDRLADKGRSGMFFFSDVPFIGLWRDKYMDITSQLSAFHLMAQGGQLPDVSYIDPNFGGSVGESPTGVSQDDHPQADVRNGQNFLNQIYDSVRTSPQWDRTLLIINYDEWGGFYDHVLPPKAPVTPEEFALFQNDGRLGFRVPCILIGPRARKGYVDHNLFDHNSVLNFICWRFGLDTLAARGQSSLNLAYALDFAGPARTDAAPVLDVPSGPGLPSGAFGTPGLFGAPCTTLPSGVPSPAASAKSAGFDQHQAEWRALYEITKKLGFPVPR